MEIEPNEIMNENKTLIQQGAEAVKNCCQKKKDIKKHPFSIETFQNVVHGQRGCN